MAQIELGDALGFDIAWLGEIHFSRTFSILADPLMVLAAAAQRTAHIRLGTAVTLLPLHNPIKIAEEAATADILSDGRLDFGVGRGVLYQYPGYGIPPEESRERSRKLSIRPPANTGSGPITAVHRSPASTVTT